MSQTPAYILCYHTPSQSSWSESRQCSVKEKNVIDHVLCFLTNWGWPPFFPWRHFKIIFLHEICCILLKISLKFVSKGSIYNYPALFPAYSSNNGLARKETTSHYWLFTKRWHNTAPPRWVLTHWSRHKMATISQTFWNAIFLNVLISIDTSLKFIPKGPIDNISALVEIMAWRRTGDKRLFEPMVAYMRRSASVS